MGKFTYYLATSLDGYLARKNGAVDWLEGFPTKLSTPYDYETFYATVSAVVMGRKTWEIVQALEAEPYKGKPCYVFSLTNPAVPSYVKVLELSAETVRDLKARHEGRIWLVGGAEIAAHLIEMEELDEIVQTIVPKSIGEGIPWLREMDVEARWELREMYQAEEGMVQLVYGRSR